MQLKLSNQRLIKCVGLAIKLAKPPTLNQSRSTQVKNLFWCLFFFAVNVTALKKSIAIDVSFCEIGNLCHRNDDSTVEIKFFDLPQDITEVLYPLHEVQESSTFQQLWTQYGKRAQKARMNDEAQQRDLSVFKVLESVWKPAYEAWKQIAVSTLDGSIYLGDVDKYFRGYKGKKEDLERDLFCIFNLDRSYSISSDQLKAIAKKRAEQVQLYQQIQQYASAAESIWDFKQWMGFSGDFKIVEDLRNQVRRVKCRRKAIERGGVSTVVSFDKNYSQQSLLIMTLLYFFQNLKAIRIHLLTAKVNAL